MNEKEKLNENEREALKEKHRYYIRIISAVVFLLAMVGITYLIFPILKNLGQEGWQEKVREAITSHGTIGGLFVFLAIQALQVVVAVVPAIQAVGGVLYGWFFGGLVSFAGITLGTLAVWGIVKRLGKPLVEAVIGEKHVKRFGFLEDEHKLIIILIILYVIPGVPKDVITYLVPLTDIKLRDFLLYVIPFRLPAIMLTTALGSNLTKGNYTAAIVITGAIVVIAVLGFIFKDRILSALDKRKKGGTAQSTAEETK